MAASEGSNPRLCRRAAAFLLIPTILQWRQAVNVASRYDDSIGHDGGVVASLLNMPPTLLTAAAVASDARASSDDGDWWEIRPPPTNGTERGIVPAASDIHNVSSAASSSFARYDGVVIVTKVLGHHLHDVDYLKRWVCAIQSSYNDAMRYDYVIFTTLPWHPRHVRALQDVARPAKLVVSLEGPTLHEQIDEMTEEERRFLYERCGSSWPGGNISWFHYCTEPGMRGITNLGYAWQAEFRSYHIWTHPALKGYRYMMWIDSDAYVTEEWSVDPVRAMVEGRYSVLYAGWPYGKLSSDVIREKLVRAYGTSICNVANVGRGGRGQQLVARTCQHNCTIKQIAGNHHITDLDVFRKPVHQRFLRDFTQDYRFGRRYDDQIAVTIVGLMEQYLVNNRTGDLPTRFTVGHERTLGFPLRIVHHCMYDADSSDRANCKFGMLYKNVLKGRWPGLTRRCGPYVRRVRESRRTAMEEPP